MSKWEEFIEKYPGGIMNFETESGYTGVIRMNKYLRTLCGYVILPESHPLYGIEDEMDSKFDKIAVHGGITFAGIIPDYGYAVGFDCAHADDLIPFHCPSERLDWLFENNEKYRDEAYVRNEIEYLALELKVIERKKYK